MACKALPAVAVAAVLLCGLVLLGDGSAEAQGGDGDPVQVTNFPEVQTVEVEGTPSQARLAAFEDQLLSPHGGPDDPGAWRHAGVLVTDGFAWITPSLGGEVQGALTDPATVVAVLVPDRPLVRRALQEDQVLLFPLRVTAALEPGSEYFASQPARLAVAFPRYHVYLYNTGARTVEANLYAYLGN